MTYGEFSAAKLTFECHLTSEWHNVNYSQTTLDRLLCSVNTSSVSLLLV